MALKMSVLLITPTMSLPSNTGALRLPELCKSLAQYFSARPGETMITGLAMISWTLTLFGSFPGSTTLLTMSFRVTIPQASSWCLRFTNRLETLFFRIIAIALVAVSLPSIIATSLCMTSPTLLNLAFFRLSLVIPCLLCSCALHLAGWPGKHPRDDCTRNVDGDNSRGFATGGAPRAGGGRPRHPHRVG